MSDRPNETIIPLPKPPPLEAPTDSTESDSNEGMLDLDDHDQINNQHLEVR